MFSDIFTSDRHNVRGKMFVLTRMKDTVRIPPNLLHLDTTQAITEIINSKLANKVNACYFAC